MKILFISDNFPPEVNAPANRTYEHCREWVLKGAEVTVITCAPNFPQGRVYEGYKNRFYQRQEVDGIQVIRVWSYIAQNAGVKKRTLDYLSFAISSFVAGLFIKTDLVIATSPQFFAALSGHLVAKIKRCKWIMEVRDLWPESIRAVGAVQNSKYLDWLERLELHLYRSANKIIVVTDAFKKNISSRGIPEYKVKVVKNGVRLDVFQARKKDIALSQSLGLADKFVVGYIGTHGMAHGLDFILRSVHNLNVPIQFLFIGDGAEKEKIQLLKEELDLKNVTLLPPVLKSKIQQYISIIDVALVPLRKSDTFKTVIPSKIFENASMLKPILLGVEGESKEIVEKYNAGLCFKPENKEDFLQKLMALYTDQKLYENCQKGCEKLAKNFDRTVLAQRMLEHLINTVPQKGLRIEEKNQKVRKNGMILK